MQVVGNLIERGQIEFGLVVDGESSRTVVEATLARLSLDSCDAQMLRDQLATLTVGSGAAAMILAHTRLAPGGHRFHGGTSLAATEHNQLCRGQLDVGITDTRSLLLHGVALAQRTWAQAQKELGWSAESVDLFALHQVSELHTQELARAVGFDLAKAFLIYPELGNVGPASVRIVLAKAVEAERVVAGATTLSSGASQRAQLHSGRRDLVRAHVTDRSRVSPALYPFADHFLDRGGLRLHYLDEGQGEPVVMLHGNPTWSFHFRSLVLALRDRHRVVVPDHMGMGLSDKPGDGQYHYCLQSRADDLAALLDHLNIVHGVTWSCTTGAR